ncbi:MAG: 16S rRNA (uracil(1498)-N(3))-methyltransferase [Blastochloris viridis]|uniref:Ribosomal RNA small subunit methyltransferase E n=1 Tax=Blastochloris viridis TaxID=1079 RepID=A0A6N4RDL1_BLAVI|nr:MAG: 16S rRNA (uracil(1498)-N(3))-methyltransferase [Blastochloris viridis]
MFPTATERCDSKQKSPTGGFFGKSFGMKRIYLPHALAPGAHLELPDHVQHRLFRVMRMGVGDTFHVFDGTGTAAVAELTDAKGRRAQVTALLPDKPALPPRVLAVALLKRDAWETVLRQATEMGVTSLVPLKTRFAQVGKLNTERAHAIMVEAAEQCERVTLPSLLPVTTLEDYIAGLTTPCLWAYERLAVDNAQLGEKAKATGVLIGPEGGFAPEEVEMLNRSSQMRPFSLGPTILRADTAVVAGLATLQALHRDDAPAF